MPKQETPQGVQTVPFRGQDWYEATNDRSQQVFRTPQEAEQRHNLIDAVSKAYNER